MSQVLTWPATLPLVEADCVDLADGMAAVVMADGSFLSVQPDGRIEYRTEVRSWEMARRVGSHLLRYSGAGQDRYVVLFPRSESMPPTPLPTPDRNVVSFDVPRNYDFRRPEELRTFVVLALTLAYGEATDAATAAWIAYAPEMLARGVELQMQPPERYFWERMIGRGSGGISIAKFGPYAGRSEDQTSRTPWP
jgi:hypothetical protein